MNKFITRLLIIIFGLNTINIYAQVGIGTLIPTAALDINSSNDGLLIPRVALSSTLAVLPVITPTTSELVYNTATVGDVSPGFYYLSSNTGPWVRLNRDPQAWQILGNTEIVAGTNFIGTGEDTNVDVEFRRNNTQAGTIGLTTTNFGLASSAVNTADGTTAFGVNALTANTSGANNTAVGYLALQTNVTGSSNTAVGTNVLFANTGNNNTAVGHAALDSNTSGYDNTALGTNALTANTTGFENVAIGFNASANSTGNANTVVGHSAGISSGAANNQTIMGFQAGQSSTAGNSTIIGFQAGNTNTGGDSTLLGHQAGQFNAGTRATIVGHGAGFRNTGPQNTYIGWNAGALMNQSACANNVAIGAMAMQSNVSRVNSNSVAVGYQALQNPSNNANNNTAVGYQAGLLLTSGSNNTMIGNGANATTGNNSTAVGQWASTSTFNNSTSLGNEATSNDNNQITLGNASILQLRCQVTSITALSDKRDKTNIETIAEGIEFIKQLKPVTYDWKTRDHSKVGIKAAGFIAQDLLELQLKSDIGENLDIVSYNNPDKLEARYSNLLPVIVKGIQDQQVQIDQLKKDIEDLKAINTAILQRLEQFENNKIVVLN